MEASRPTEVLTIGHSTHSLDAFLSLLKRHDVSAVADVRSSPCSKLNPHFDREYLTRSLIENGIAYSFLGQELGGRPKDESCYEHGRVQYRRLAESQDFRKGIERILVGSQRYRIAILCSEHEPLNCHRAILISPELEKLGISVVHIRSDGGAEPHAEAVARLLDSFGLLKQSLFMAQSDLIIEAYARQQERIAYTRKSVQRDRIQASR